MSIGAINSGVFEFITSGRLTDRRGEGLCFIICPSDSDLDLISVGYNFILAHTLNAKSNNIMIRLIKQYATGGGFQQFMVHVQCRESGALLRLRNSRRASGARLPEDLAATPVTNRHGLLVSYVLSGYNVKLNAEQVLAVLRHL